MNTTPIFIGTPRCGVVNITTANTNNDGTGTIGTVFTAGANGSLITAIRLQACQTTTLGRINLYIHNGTSSFLWTSVITTAPTVAANVKPFDYDVPMPGPMAYAASAVVNASVSLAGLALNGLYLPAGYSLRASTYIGESYNVIAIGGDY